MGRRDGQKTHYCISDRYWRKSYLGPEFLYEALRADAACKKAAEGRTLKFIANVDPVDFARQVDGVEVVAREALDASGGGVSKSFTTAETIMNAKTVKDWLTSSIKAIATDVVRQHVAAVSTQMQLTADFGIAPENVFAFGDYVGRALFRAFARGCSTVGSAVRHGAFTRVLEWRMRWTCTLRLRLWNGTYLYYWVCSASTTRPFSDTTARPYCPTRKHY